MSRLIADICRARREGRLAERFHPDDLRIACPGRAERTYGALLPKHPVGDPANYTAYFAQHPDGTHSLL